MKESLFKELKTILPLVDKPGRYIGGEPRTSHKEEAKIKVALCFPDLYEIAMSNQAIRILYKEINSISGVLCERVFAPAPDFEQILAQKNIPLYSLETGRAVKEFDILAFSVGYELSFTNILTVLHSSHIPIERKDRGAEDPVVIAGGPAMTNPYPYSDFIDGVFIGEAEGAITSFIEEILETEGDRKSILPILHQNSHFWFPGKEATTRRALWWDFTKEKKETSSFPIPTLRPVQDHGVVEIMRGCPKGCRFCHAGIFYRPFRAKSFDQIDQEVHNQVFNYGYRDITLSSLSSGDYEGICKVARKLNEKYNPVGVSFGLPSLRVNSMTLDLIEEVSKVKKSGLTFAIESPKAQWQRGVNKIVPIDRTIELLLEAKARGWKTAKFYFMLGLPVAEKGQEAEEIIGYLKEVHQKTKMKINANVGVFIPKPHTPFQWAPQLTEEEGREQIYAIRDALRGMQIKVGFHDPFQSFLEGILARGDEKSGQLFYEGWKRGARLDAWDEFINKPLWREVIENATWEVEKETCSPRSSDDKLIWDKISLGVTHKFIKDEWNKACTLSLTDSCNDNCDHNCGLCKVSTGIIKPDLFKIPDTISHVKTKIDTIEGSKNFLIKYKKTGRSSFISHLNMIELFEKFLFLSGLSSVFTQGFHPKPKLQFTNPISLGVDSLSEYLVLELHNDISPKQLAGLLAPNLPEGMELLSVYHLDKGERRLPSLMSLQQFVEYDMEFNSIEALKMHIDSFTAKLAASKDSYLKQEDLRLLIGHRRKDVKGNPIRWIQESQKANPWTILTFFTKNQDYIEEEGALKPLEKGFRIKDSWHLPTGNP